MTDAALTVLVVGGATARQPLLRDLEPRDDHEVTSDAAIAALIDVVAVDDPAAAALRCAEARVAVVVLAPTAQPIDALIARLDQLPALSDARVVLVTDRRGHDDVSRAIDTDRLDAVVALPWRPGELRTQVTTQLTRWLRPTQPDHPALLALDAQDRYHRAYEAPSSELLRDLELDDHAIALRLSAAIDRALGRRPRLRLARGTRLTHQNRPVNGVFVIRSGSVALDRSTSLGEIRLHHGSTGPVVGLLSLAQQRRAFFTARTTTDVEVLHLDLEQLDRALRLEPEVGAAMAAASVRALARRLRRAEQLQLEKRQLNEDLEAERQRLADALAALEAARLELVEQARFATLGELAAGVAHELNNPVAALSRAASFVAEDVTTLLGDHPQAAVIRPALAAARTRPALRAAQERAARRELAAALGDAEAARRFVAAGITDVEVARELTRHGADTVAVVESAASLGTALRNLEVGASRIAELVDSLRAYARPDREPIEGLDVNELLEDTLRLVAHRLEGTTVTRRYGELPPLRGRPGPLDQVWTNLLVNAAESLDGGGSIEVITDHPDPDHVRVRIVDDGPGIDPELVDQLFEPRFTTKHGQVRYGLGLGLPIAKRTVEAHGGTITLDTAPGRTCATVLLPVSGPDDEEAGA